MKKPRQGFVYFLQVRPDGPVKIGFSADPRARIATLQTASPYPLDVIGVMKGSEQLEGGLHKILGSDRLTGEWFKPTPRVLRYAHLMMLATGEARGEFDDEPVPRAIDLAARLRSGELPLTRETGDALALAVLDTRRMRLLMRCLSDAPTHEERAREVARALCRPEGDGIDRDAMRALLKPLCPPPVHVGADEAHERMFGPARSARP